MNKTFDGNVLFVPFDQPDIIPVDITYAQTDADSHSPTVIRLCVDAWP